MANARARELRKSMTEGEQKLWRILRYKQLANLRFRRQQPIGPYIVDFFCPSARLVVEVDGEPHADETRMRRDAARTRWLEAHGCLVIRFWNIEVFQHPDIVADAVAACTATVSRAQHRAFLSLSPLELLFAHPISHIRSEPPAAQKPRGGQQERCVRFERSELKKSTNEYLPSTQQRLGCRENCSSNPQHNCS